MRVGSCELVVARPVNKGVFIKRTRSSVPGTEVNIY